MGNLVAKLVEYCCWECPYAIVSRFCSDYGDWMMLVVFGVGAGEGEGAWEIGRYVLCRSAWEHCFSALARAALMKVLSLQRHATSLAWQPVEPTAERAGLCWGVRMLA